MTACLDCGGSECICRFRTMLRETQNQRDDLLKQIPDILRDGKISVRHLHRWLSSVFDGWDISLTDEELLAFSERGEERFSLKLDFCDRLNVFSVVGGDYWQGFADAYAEVLRGWLWQCRTIRAALAKVEGGPQ